MLVCVCARVFLFCLSGAGIILINVNQTTLYINIMSLPTGGDETEELSALLIKYVFLNLRFHSAFHVKYLFYGQAQ